MVKIEIVSKIDTRMNDSFKFVGESLEGKRKVREGRFEKTIIMTPEVFSKVFSPQRIKLMLLIKQNNSDNIYQVAKKLDRKYEAVHRDIKYLEGLGIINTKKLTTREFHLYHHQLYLNLQHSN